MARYRICKACGDLHSLEAWPRECISDVESRRSHLAAPAVRPDGMGAIQSMADGRMYDSKSAYYDSVRRAGCEIVGDDRAGFGKPPTADSVVPANVGADIKKSIEQLRGRAA